MTTLDNVKIGQRCKIKSFLPGQESVKNRLFELGFLPGQIVVLQAKSILNKVFLVEVRNGLLSVRKDILKSVVVE